MNNEQSLRSRCVRHHSPPPKCGCDSRIWSEHQRQTHDALSIMDMLYDGPCDGDVWECDSLAKFQARTLHPRYSSNVVARSSSERIDRHKYSCTRCGTPGSTEINALYIRKGVSRTLLPLSVLLAGFSCYRLNMLMVQLLTFPYKHMSVTIGATFRKLCGYIVTILAF